MATYSDLKNTQLPSLGEMVARMKMKRAANAKNPGARPEDADGRQQQVMIEGEASIQAQPVSGPGVTGSVGTPQIIPRRQATLGGVGAPQILPRQPDATVAPISGVAQGGQMNPQAAMDPRAAQLRALMGQGLTFQQAMQRIQQGG